MSKTFLSSNITLSLSLTLLLSACGQSAKVTRHPSVPTQATANQSPEDAAANDLNSSIPPAKPNEGKPLIEGPMGPQGPVGPAGPAGKDARDALQFRVGPDMPLDDEGEEGDQYVWCKTGHVFEKIGGHWTIIARIKKMKCAKVPSGPEQKPSDLESENPDFREAPEAANSATPQAPKKKKRFLFFKSRRAQ